MIEFIEYQHLKQIRILAVIFIIPLFISCTKNNGNIEERNMAFTISHSDTLRYSLGSFGDEEGATIQLQAEHFQISELNRNGNSGEIVYQYKADSTFTGSDYVELKSTRGSNGESPGNFIIITKIIIDIK